jgi:Yip1 domain/GYF domain 2
MALIHIARDHKPLGTITEDELRDGIFSGKYVATDLVWREGMAEWKPLSEMASQWGMETPAPALVPVVKTEPVSPEAESDTEPAWEDRERLGIFPAITRTVSAVLMRPAETFAAMKRTGGLADPMIFFVGLFCAQELIETIWHLVSIYSVPQSTFAELLPPFLKNISKNTIGIYYLGNLLLSPAIAVASIFFFSGLTHLSLLLVRGAKHPFETTFRAQAYLNGAFCIILTLVSTIFGMVGIFGFLLGFLIFLAWVSYNTVISLKEAHGIELWRSIAALTIFSVFATLLFLVIAALIGAAAISHLH